MTVTEIRKRWSEVLTRVSRGESIVVTRRGRKVGLMISAVQMKKSEPVGKSC